jgi:ribonuclease P protein component
LVNQGFKSIDRIKKAKQIEKIFDDGKVLSSENRKLKATFLIQKNNDKSRLQFGVAVYKKAGTAVWRNRLKRLIREAYRKNKESFFQFIVKNNLQIYLIISPGSFNQSNNPKLSLSEIEPVVIELIKKVAVADITH